MSQETYILMLEDDQDDRSMTSAVVEELQIPVPVRFLTRSSLLFETLAESEPMLIVLDYNLNPETGLDILRKLKADANYRHIPVVLLGETDDPHFVAQCYQHGASTYARKPGTFEGTRKKIGLFFQYWLSVAGTSRQANETSIHS
ncbi:MAG: hypothetical protein JWP27_107 [Flaviaesturariibacter sp.]|nr:hypothetical protein [Flaviaesturariibacter sp.]